VSGVAVRFESSFEFPFTGIKQLAMHNSPNVCTASPAITDNVG
jgi:hypothetical protein